MDPVVTCEHGAEGPDVAVCPPCLSGGLQARRQARRARFTEAYGQPRRVRRAVVARYDGECPECGSVITPEESLVAMGDDGSWWCADCAGAAL